jgi:YfiH family protein
MKISFKRNVLDGHFVNVHETPGMILGFTEHGFSLQALSRAIDINADRMLRLKQVHSDTVRFSSHLKVCEETEGDGIILDEKGLMAIVRTADCTPLFFWHPDYTVAGVLHIGWRGLWKGIEKKLAAVLKEKMPADQFQRMNFYLGPSIEASCYEVGPDLWEKFADKPFRGDIFYKSPGKSDNKNERMVMDVKKGIRLSLMETGVPDGQIYSSPLCTYCETSRFPSYRRSPGSGQRIYNFLLLK